MDPDMDPYMDPIRIPMWILCPGGYMKFHVGILWILHGSLYGSYMDPYVDRMPMTFHEVSWRDTIDLT